MKMLLIMRHAKSSWKDVVTSDFERPLNKRGNRDATRIGEWLREQNLVPDLILASAAVRAESTAERVADALNSDAEMRFSKALYLAPSNVYLNLLSELSYEEKNDGETDPSRFDCVLIVGHNPGVSHLVYDLTGEFREMPTAALAILELPIDSWGELTESRPNGTRATLKTYLQPGDLPDSDD